MENFADLLSGGGLFEPLAKHGLGEHLRQLGKSLEMLGRFTLGNKKEANEMGRRVVGRFEINPFRRASEDCNGILQAGDAAMGNGHTRSQTSADMGFTFKNSIAIAITFAGGNPANLREVIDHLKDDLLVFDFFELEDHALGRDQLSEACHSAEWILPANPKEEPC